MIGDFVEQEYANRDFHEHAPTLRNMAHGFVLELGPNTGDSSTRAIWYGLRDWVKGQEGGEYKGEPLHITVDYQDFLVMPPDAPWFHKVIGSSQDDSTVEKVKLIAGNRKANVIFIDTIHEYNFLKRELELWQEMASSETVWLFHDTWMNGVYNHMTDAIKEFAASHPEWEYIDLSKTCNGLGMLRPVQ